MLRIDVATRKVEATIELAGRNPFNPMAEHDGALFLAEPGNFDAGDEPLAGIERFDTATSTTRLLVTEQDLGGSVAEVAVTDGCGVAIVAGPQQDVNPTSLVTFDPDDRQGAQLRASAPCSGRRPATTSRASPGEATSLYVGDRRRGAGGLSGPRLRSRARYVHPARSSRPRIRPPAAPRRPEAGRLSMTIDEHDAAAPEQARKAGRGGLAVLGAKVFFIATGLLQQALLPRAIGLADYGALSRVLAVSNVFNNVIVASSTQGVSRTVAAAGASEREALARDAARARASSRSSRASSSASRRRSSRSSSTRPTCSRRCSR